VAPESNEGEKNYISLVFEKLAHSANFLMARNFFKFIIMMKFVKVRKNLITYGKIDKNSMKNVIFYTIGHFSHHEPDGSFSKLHFLI
jgi:hypothetical protein